MNRVDRVETHAVLEKRGGVAVLAMREGSAPTLEDKRERILRREAKELDRLLRVRALISPPPAMTMTVIALAVGQHFRITGAEIKSKNRFTGPRFARLVAYFLSRELTTASFPTIGRFFGKDHTCALKGNRRLADRLAAGDNQLASDLGAIKERIGL